MGMGSGGSDYEGEEGGGGYGNIGMGEIAAGMTDDQVMNLRRFNFVVQFAWVETPPSVRDQKKEELLAEQEAMLGTGEDGTGNPAEDTGEIPGAEAPGGSTAPPPPSSEPIEPAATGTTPTIPAEETDTDEAGTPPTGTTAAADTTSAPDDAAASPPADDSGNGENNPTP